MRAPLSPRHTPPEMSFPVSRTPRCARIPSARRQRPHEAVIRSSPQTLAPSLDRAEARPLLRAPERTTLQTIAAVATLPMIAVTLGLAWSANHLQHPVA